jgi:hypothetical protein
LRKWPLFEKSSAKTPSKLAGGSEASTAQLIKAFCFFFKKTLPC